MLIKTNIVNRKKIFTLIIIGLTLTLVVLSLVIKPSNSNSRPRGVEVGIITNSHNDYSNDVSVPMLKQLNTISSFQQFNVNNLKTEYYSDIFLFSNKDFRGEVLSYCNNAPISSSVARDNCNAAFKTSNIWYQIYEWSSLLIYFITIKVILYGLVIVWFIAYTKRVLKDKQIKDRHTKLCSGNSAAWQKHNHSIND